MKPGAAGRDVAERLAPGHLRLRLTLAFDGTHYAGWQRQEGVVTVQQRVEDALGRVFPSRPCVRSSSRTDTGVHAVGMVVHFDVPRIEFRFPPAKLVLAANAWLPDDIRVVGAARARPDFHARFSALGKQYRYVVWNHPAHAPLDRNLSWHVPRPLDVTAMRAAARVLLGQHDFLAFSASPGYARRHTVRKVTRCEVRRTGRRLTLIIEADGFLYKMCRGIAGTLVQAGLGRFRPEDLKAMLAGRDRRLAGMTAPARGLVLWKVFYARGAGALQPGRANGEAAGAPAE